MSLNSSELFRRKKQTVQKLVEREFFFFKPKTCKAAFTPKAAGQRASIQSQRIDALQAPGTRLYVDRFRRAAFGVNAA